MAHSQTYLPPRGWPPADVPEVDTLTAAQFLRKYLGGRSATSISIHDYSRAIAMTRERMVREQCPCADLSMIDFTIPSRLRTETADRWAQEGYFPYRVVEATKRRKRPIVYVATPWPSAEVIRAAEIFVHVYGMATSLDGARVTVHYCTEEAFAQTMEKFHSAFPCPRLGPGKHRRMQHADTSAAATT